jgi:hypothetical protein
MDPRDILTDEELKMLLSNDPELKPRAEDSEHPPILLPRSSKHTKKKSIWATLFKKSK